MTSAPNVAPKAPESDSAKQADKSATETKPVVTPAPAEAPPADAKKI